MNYSFKYPLENDPKWDHDVDDAEVKHKHNRNTLMSTQDLLGCIEVNVCIEYTFSGM